MRIYVPPVSSFHRTPFCYPVQYPTTPAASTVQGGHLIDRKILAFQNVSPTAVNTLDVAHSLE